MTSSIDLRGQVTVVTALERIVNIASGGGATMLPYFSAYVTSKTALIRFSERLAAEVKADGLAVFAMGPGTVRTAMAEDSLDSPNGGLGCPGFGRLSMKAAIYHRSVRLHSCGPWPPAGRMACQEAFFSRGTISIQS